MQNAATPAEPVVRRARHASSPWTTSAPRPARYWFFNPIAWIALLALKAYQICVPARYKPKCRFTPTCSRYMALAIRKYGLLTGMKMGWNRFWHCVGFVPGGEDWP